MPGYARGTKVHTRKDGTKYIKKKKPTSTKQVAKIAKAVVINNQEMLKRESGLQHVSYYDRNRSGTPGPGTVFKGLGTRSPFNFILNPLNWGWENDQSTPGSSDNWHFVGKGIHPRYLKQRLLFEFPGGEQSIIQPVRIQLIWGFFKRPCMLTSYSTPKQAEVTRSELIKLFQDQIQSDFDTSDDQLKFRTKRPTNYIITGKKWIKPDRRHRIGVPQQQSWHDQALVGNPPDVMETIQWKMGKEWRLARSTNAEDPYDVFNYNNESWAPFAVIYNPDYCNVKQAEDPGNPGCGGGEEHDPVPEENRIQVSHNSCMWYNDA
ncbi:MAG: hypothetical protein [Circular genetic element sp.]|nr:MAG: hypothetical protein [Circular genetic element sp.]